MTVDARRQGCWTVERPGMDRRRRPGFWRDQQRTSSWNEADRIQSLGSWHLASIEHRAEHRRLYLIRAFQLTLRRPKTPAKSIARSTCLPSRPGTPCCLPQSNHQDWTHGGRPCRALSCRGAAFGLAKRRIPPAQIPPRTRWLSPRPHRSRRLNAWSY